MGRVLLIIIENGEILLVNVLFFLICVSYTLGCKENRYVIPTNYPYKIIGAFSILESFRVEKKGYFGLRGR